MDSNTALTENETPTRRKILYGVGILSILAAISTFLRFPIAAKKNAIACKPESKKIKMLSQDGRLVEIDESLLTQNKRKISDKELQHWIKK
ncbi:MAG: hypothetical protein JST58_02750 [Bacteroidetes bacterium]|nr:hypothetical protein [Bacteroidota bacterium]